jgi:heterodisulfide reductase subunit C
MATPGECHLDMCIQCGTCGGSCPSGADMDHTPRQIFAMIRAGLREQALSSNTPWFCVSCYYCTVRCPQDIHITDIMYTLKRMALREKMYDDSTAPDFSRIFIGWVEGYGRAFELGLMSLHILRHHALGAWRMAPMGIGMVTKGRMDFTPKSIKGIDGLKAILAKAKELEVRNEV